MAEKKGNKQKGNERIEVKKKAKGKGRSGIDRGNREYKSGVFCMLLELELICKVYNINAGKNKELLEQCQFLKEYAIFVGRVRGNYETNGYQDLEWRIKGAIDYCIRESVLRGFLTERRAEIG